MAYNQRLASDCPIKTEAPKPTAEPQRPELSPTGFRHPLPPGNASFSTWTAQQDFICHVDGCYETRPHAHAREDEGVFFQSSQENLEDGGFRVFLDSINNDRAEFSRQASHSGNNVYLSVDHENPRDPGMLHTRSSSPQNDSFEAFSAQLERTDEMEHECIIDDTTGAHFSIFRVEPPFPEPEQANPNRPQIMYAGPARPEHCASPTCPIHEAHGVGLYVHNGQWGLWPNETFGISNPPDHIWAAYARSLANRASPEDLEMIRQFVVHHDRPYPGA